MEFPVDGSQEQELHKVYNMLHKYTSPRQAWDALLAWYGPQTTGAKHDLSRRLNSFKTAIGSNPFKEMGRIECLAAEMRTAGLSLDDHMLYTIFIDTVTAKMRGGSTEPGIS